MPIHIPLLGPIEWLPQLDRDKIPIAEHPALQHIVGLLTALAVQERNFRTAVLLFEASHQENSELANAVSSGVLDFGTLDRATDTLSGWQSIAARDGAMTIYHFGCTVEAIKASLPRCPTLNAGVDHSNLRMARKLFESHFPGYKDIRHVVAHTAEFAATIDDKEIHSHKGRLKISSDSGSVSMEVSDQSASTQFLGNLCDNTYFITFEGRIHKYEISHATAEKLVSVKKRVFSSVGQDIVKKPA
jgi:hypothetical protein